MFPFRYLNFRIGFILGAAFFVMLVLGACSGEQMFQSSASSMPAVRVSSGRAFGGNLATATGNGFYDFGKVYNGSVLELVIENPQGESFAINHIEVSPDSISLLDSSRALVIVPDNTTCVPGGVIEPYKSCTLSFRVGPTGVAGGQVVFNGEKIASIRYAVYVAVPTPLASPEFVEPAN